MIGNASVRKLDDARIEQRRANLERRQHARAVHLDQDVIDEVTAKIHGHRSLNGRAADAQPRFRVFRRLVDRNPGWGKQTLPRLHVEIDICVSDAPVDITACAQEIVASPNTDRKRAAEGAGHGAERRRNHLADDVLPANPFVV